MRVRQCEIKKWLFGNRRSASSRAEQLPRFHNMAASAEVDDDDALVDNAVAPAPAPEPVDHQAHADEPAGVKNAVVPRQHLADLLLTVDGRATLPPSRLKQLLDAAPAALDHQNDSGYHQHRRHHCRHPCHRYPEGLPLLRAMSSTLRFEQPPPTSPPSCSSCSSS